MQLEMFMIELILMAENNKLLRQNQVPWTKHSFIPTEDISTISRGRFRFSRSGRGCPVPGSNLGITTASSTLEMLKNVFKKQKRKAVERMAKRSGNKNKHRAQQNWWQLFLGCRSSLRCTQDKQTFLSRREQPCEGELQRGTQENESPGSCVPPTADRWRLGWGRQWRVGRQISHRGKNMGTGEWNTPKLILR